MQRNEERISADVGFTTDRVPSMSIGDYLRRIAKYSIASAETYIYCLIYLDRFNETRGDTYLNKRSVHK